MTLQDFINKYNGHVVGGGQCGDLVDAYLEQVLSCNTTYNTAYEYWTNGIPGFSVVTSPEAGDIACYKPHGTFTAGHIAIYNGGGIVFEQNADPDGSPAHLYARANTYLLGYLRKDTEMADLWNNGDTENLMIKNGLGAMAQEAVAANFVGYFGAEEGKDFKTAMYDIINSPQWAFAIAAVQSGTLNKTVVENYISQNLQ